MIEIQKAKIILKILNKTYPKIKVPLKSRNVFTLLISVLLSAQCTDINVNNVTKSIFTFKRNWRFRINFIKSFSYNLCLLFFIHYEKLSKSLIEYNPGFFLINHSEAVKAPSE